MYYLLNLLLYLKVTIATGVGQQGNWDKKSDISVRLGSHSAVGDTLTAIQQTVTCMDIPIVEIWTRETYAFKTQMELVCASQVTFFYRHEFKWSWPGHFF